MGAERAPRDPGRLSSAPQDPRYSPWHGKLPGLLSALGLAGLLNRLLLCTRCNFLPLGSSLVFPCCSLHLYPHLSVSSCLSLSVSATVTPFSCLLPPMCGIPCSSVPTLPISSEACVSVSLRASQTILLPGAIWRRASTGAMAVPSLWPWVACLLVVLLSLGLGLDTLEGESPALSWSRISLPAS